MIHNNGLHELPLKSFIKMEKQLDPARCLPGRQNYSVDDGTKLNVLLLQGKLLFLLHSTKELLIEIIMSGGINLVRK